MSNLALYLDALADLPAPAVMSDNEIAAAVHAGAVRLGKLKPSHADGGDIYEALTSLAKRWDCAITGLANEVNFALGAPSDGMDSGADALWRQMAGETKGLGQRHPLPWKQVCECSRPLLPGSIAIMAGKPGSGKSWAGMHLHMEAIAAGIPSSMIALEEHRPWHLRRSLALLSGDMNVLNPDHIRKYPELLDQVQASHSYEIDKITPTIHCHPSGTLLDVLSLVEERIKHGDRIVIVDPITVADPGTLKPWEADRIMMARLGECVSKSKASVLLLTHPKKAGGGGKPAVPTMDDLAGGAAISRLASAVLWLEPLPRNHVGQWTANGENYVGAAHKRIRVLKSRNGPGEGRAFLCTFHALRLEELGEEITDA